MNIMIVGSNGRIGHTLYTILSESTNTVIGADLHNADMIESQLGYSDLIILATPLKETVEYIQRYSGRAKIIEVTSTKTVMLEYSGEVISIHPLFGPRTAGKEGFKNIIFVKDVSPKGSLDVVKQLFPQHEIKQLTAREHDLMMVKLQVIPYFISLLSKSVDSPTDLKTMSKKALEEMAYVCEYQNLQVVYDTIKRNPYSADAFSMTLRKLEEIGGELLDSDTRLNTSH